MPHTKRSKFYHLIDHYVSPSSTKLWRANSEPLLRAWKADDLDIRLYASKENVMELAWALVQPGPALANGSAPQDSAGCHRVDMGLLQFIVEAMRRDSLQVAESICVMEALAKHYTLVRSTVPWVTDHFTLGFLAAQVRRFPVTQCHAHRVVAALTQRRDLDGAALYKWAKAAGPPVHALVLFNVHHFLQRGLKLSDEILQYIAEQSYLEELFHAIYKEPCPGVRECAGPKSVSELRLDLIHMASNPTLPCPRYAITLLLLMCLNVIDMAQIPPSTYLMHLVQSEELTQLTSKQTESLLMQCTDVLQCSTGDSVCHGGINLPLVLEKSKGWHWIKHRRSILQRIVRLLAGRMDVLGVLGIEDTLGETAESQLASIGLADEDGLYQTLLDMLHHDHSHVVGYSSCCAECYCD